MENHKESNKDSNEVSNEELNYSILDNKKVLSHLIKFKDKMNWFDKLIHTQGRDYLLRYKLNYKKNNPRDMSIDEMYEYVEKFYRGGLFKKDNLKNDLVVFKSYKDELEIELRRREFFVSCLNGAITAFALLLSLLFPFGFEEKKLTIKYFGLIVLALVYTFILNYMLWSYPDSKPNRIKTLADNINYLTSMKEEVYNIDKKPIKSKENSERIRELEKFETSKKTE